MDEIHPTGDWREVAVDGGAANATPLWRLFRADASAAGAECWAFEANDAHNLAPVVSDPHFSYKGKEFVCFERLRLGTDPSAAVYVPFVNRHSVAGFVATGITEVHMKTSNGEHLTATSTDGWFAAYLETERSLVEVSIDLGGRGHIRCTPVEGDLGDSLGCHGFLRSR